MSLLNSMPRLGLVAVAALLIPTALPQQPQRGKPQEPENQKAKISRPGHGPGWGGIFTASPEAHLQHSRGLAPNKTIVNDSIVNDSIPERRRKLATTRNLRGAQRNGTLVVQKPPEPDQAPTIKIEVDVVNILCSVRNRQGGLVGGLAKDDFLLSEDGKPQTLKYFTRETDLPLTLGLLVDVSRSQERLIEIEKQAASQFFSSVLRPKDLAFLISFGSEAELLQDHTSSARLLRDGLEGLKVNAPVGGPMPGPVPTVYQPRGTVLYDAVYLAATDRLKDQVGRKALVLITDGVDQGSRLKLEDALQAAQKADAIIYSIYYVDPSAYYGRGFFGGVSDAALKKMSEETGGRLFRVSKNNPLPAIFDQIQQEMRSQYALGYTPANPIGDGTFRRLDIKTRQKDLKVQARKGYYASKQVEP